VRRDENGKGIRTGQDATAAIPLRGARGAEPVADARAGEKGNYPGRKEKG